MIPPIRVRRPLTMPCCGHEVELQLAFDETPAPGAKVNVECPYCGEDVVLVLHAIPVSRN